MAICELNVRIRDETRIRSSGDGGVRPTSEMPFQFTYLPNGCNTKINATDKKSTKKERNEVRQSEISVQDTEFWPPNSKDQDWPRTTQSVS